MGTCGTYDPGSFRSAYDKVMAKWPEGREAVGSRRRSGRRT
ncbi:hypothetical protein ACRAWF_00815 [Streptomyces sp. L7]